LASSIFDNRESGWNPEQSCYRIDGVTFKVWSYDRTTIELSTREGEMFTVMSKSEDLPHFNGESRDRSDSQSMD